MEETEDNFPTYEIRTSTNQKNSTIASKFSFENLHDLRCGGAFSYVPYSSYASATFGFKPVPLPLFDPPQKMGVEEKIERLVLK